MNKSTVPHDKLTTYTSLATVVFATLAGSGVQPQVFGLLAAVSHAVTGFYTNK
ncbi:hypothetical protein [Pseudanabaena mucicola]|uniref:Uncharacterized protein n=1 Tax=Pseudanabaena mucicola FACHB-723 TaxID=2692860 RepID=A0ABR8A2J4_9CYAN|nr:hypothetical protein [Pseudanabaena mucicola]MBD2189766.1 hypothetical protein [Pseudanabaena mucicola FACHB-723]